MMKPRFPMLLGAMALLAGCAAGPRHEMRSSGNEYVLTRSLEVDGLPSSKAASESAGAAGDVAGQRAYAMASASSPPAAAVKSSVTATRIDVFQPPKPSISILYVGDPDFVPPAGTDASAAAPTTAESSILASGDGWSLEYVDASWPDSLPASADAGGAASAADDTRLLLRIQHGFALVRSHGAYGWPLIRSRSVGAGAQGTTLLVHHDVVPDTQDENGNVVVVPDVHRAFFLERTFLDFVTDVDVWASADDFATTPTQMKTITSTGRYLTVVEDDATLPDPPGKIADDDAIDAFVKQVIVLGKATGVLP